VTNVIEMLVRLLRSTGTVTLAGEVEERLDNSSNDGLQRQMEACNGKSPRIIAQVRASK